MEREKVQDFVDQVESRYQEESPIGTEVSSRGPTGQGLDVQQTGCWAQVGRKIFDPSSNVVFGGLPSSLARRLANYERSILINQLITKDEDEISHSELNSFELDDLYSLFAHVHNPTHLYLPSYEETRRKLIDGIGPQNIPIDYIDDSIRVEWFQPDEDGEINQGILLSSHSVVIEQSNEGRLALPDDSTERQDDFEEIFDSLPFSMSIAECREPEKVYVECSNGISPPSMTYDDSALLFDLPH
jgi:hypothetical protein